MTDRGKHNGLIIGAVFTVCSLLLTFTFVVPLLSVLPGVFFEIVSKSIVANDPYSNVGKLTIFFLTITLIVIVIAGLWSVKRQTLQCHPLSKARVSGIMSIFYFVVHPLGFYIYWGLKLGFQSDGQLLFAAADSFPFSSLSFILLGGMIDWRRNKTAKTLLPEMEIQK